MDSNSVAGVSCPSDDSPVRTSPLLNHGSRGCRLNRISIREQDCGCRYGIRRLVNRGMFFASKAHGDLS